MVHIMMLCVVVSHFWPFRPHLFLKVFFRFASISSEFSFPTKSPAEVLYSALNELEKVVSRLKGVGFFVRHL